MGTDNDAATNATRAVRIAEFWYAPAPDAKPEELLYRPAVLIDCMVNFRSLKAGLNSSEERSYTAWLSPGELPVDWDLPAVKPVDSARLTHAPAPGVAQPSLRSSLSQERLEEIERDLVETLARRERLVLYCNKLFSIFSGVDEPLDEFLARTAEIAIQEIEPELKQLKHVFELQLEQVREAHLNRSGVGGFDFATNGAVEGKAEVERLLQSRTEFFEVEKRVTSLFTGLAGFVLQMPVLMPRQFEALSDAALELREDLGRVEQEAADALNELYTRYLEMVRSYDEFEVRIQPSNIRVLRRALLWIPT